MLNGHYLGLKVVGLVVLCCLPARADAANNGAGPSEPLPDQGVCSAGVLILQKKLKWEQDQNTIAYEVDGLPFDDKEAYELRIRADHGLTIWFNGQTASGETLTARSNVTSELKIIRETNFSGGQVQITFFGSNDPNCIKVLEVPGT